jgi:thiol:disulfide interchange protein DsbD
MKNSFCTDVLKSRISFNIKLLLTHLLFFLVTFSSVASPENPVKWSITSKSLGEKKLEITMTAKLDKNFHVYTHDINPDAGPIPLSIIYEGKDVKVWNQKIVGKKVTKYDEAFGAELSWFEDKFSIVQVITSSSKSVTGTIDYMVCNDMSCMPGGYDFTVKNDQNILKNDTVQISTIDTTIAVSTHIPVMSQAQSDSFNRGTIDENCFTGEVEGKNKSIWIIFILGFLGGLLALLTPCVFPLIPMTVSYFTKGKDRKEGIRNALIYGISIVMIYITLGILATAFFGADSLNLMSTSVFFNILFFAVFMIFAMSFFGLFEITLPSGWSTQADKLSFKSGYVGIFFMAFTLALVSFSCTGPIIGSLLVEAATGNSASIGFIKINPLVGMLGFSLALALPFTLFALFPQWLQSLPKSGGWLGKVKVLLGFLELAFAFKFLSVADMIGNWGVLRWELFLVIWIVIFTLMGLYALGWPPFRHGHESHSSPIFKAIGIASLLFVPTLIFALVTYTPLKLLSGLAPPAHYNFFNNDIKEKAIFHDYAEALAYAEKHNMPLMLDFTGYGCVNCRKMEEQVWTRANVKALLSKYVIVSLITDSREPLPEPLHYYSSLSGNHKKINTVGEYWTDFEIKHFSKASQPYYVLVDTKQNMLTQPVGFADADVYERFLNCGLINYKKLND